MEKKINQNKTVIDLFSGAGGLSLGFQEAGFDIIGSAEVNSVYSKTHALNFKNSKNYSGDLNSLSPKEYSNLLGIRKIDVGLIIGGPPCQSYSNIGSSKINSLASEKKLKLDLRKYLFKPFLDYVDYFQPDIFLMENVPQLLTKEKGLLFDEVIEKIKEINYIPYWTILNSVNYGVPQNRKRLFIVGINSKIHKKKSEFKFPIPTHGSLSDMSKFYLNAIDKDNLQINLIKSNTVEDALGDLPLIFDGCRADLLPYSKNRKLTDYQKIMRNNQKLVGCNTCRISNDRAKKVFPHMLPGQKYMDLPPEIRRILPFREDIFHDRLKRLDPTKPSWTVLAHIGMDGYMYIHPSENRTLSVREAARIQSFKDSFVFTGNMREQYIQVGNAVPPILAKAIALEIKKYLYE